MCMIVYIPAGKTISEESFEYCMKGNPHGFGMMYKTDVNQLMIVKTLEYKELYKFYLQNVGYSNGSPIVIHFRYSTGGKVDIENCHPFYITPTIGFAHNGIISNCPSTDTESDTVVFNKTILQHIVYNFLEDKDMISMIESYIGYNNKLVFMSNTGVVTIANEKEGCWHEGLWYSSYIYNRSNFTNYRYSNHHKEDTKCSHEEEKFDEFLCQICMKIHNIDRLIKICTTIGNLYLCEDCISEDKPILDYLNMLPLYDTKNINKDVPDMEGWACE